jgi:hypothetical protein
MIQLDKHKDIEEIAELLQQRVSEEQTVEQIDKEVIKVVADSVVQREHIEMILMGIGSEWVLNRGKLVEYEIVVQQSGRPGTGTSDTFHLTNFEFKEMDA